MKKIFFFVFFITLITRADAIDFYWNFGNIGAGINYSPGNNDSSIELSVSFLNFTIEQKNINIGLEFSPIKYLRLFELCDEIDTPYYGERFSFINANMYWNLIGIDSLILGPFISINYLYLNTLNGLNLNEYVFGSGLRFSYKLKRKINLNKYNSQILNMEIGYKNISGISNIYFSVNVDLLLGLIAIGESARSRAY